MKPAPFTYHRARTVAQVPELLADHGEDAKIIAGGQSLVPMMNFRLATPQHLVDIGRLRELSFLHTDDQGLHIGALVTHHLVETAPADVTGPGFDILRQAMGWVGHLPIRTRGTIGGSLAHGDSTAEWCLLAILFDAVIVAQGHQGRRRCIPAEELFLGFFATTLKPEEIVIEVVFPRHAHHAAITEFAQRRGDFATVAAAVTLDVGQGAVHGGRLVLGGVAGTPQRIPEVEALLAQGRAGDMNLFADCAEAAATAIDPPDDPNGSSDYRRRLTRHLVATACQEAMNR
ncbi:FAD binding domain-containing protein [Amycolatopsis sp.]|jgi:carbon-monoxide dehydrogenase medium subunit|uniref:FAD binding domain-containing protein n=1 Tax=Amycolatopsis sp. TaxID=37632 RepID=UPI002E0C424F|nr:FAD binding domain-containing protein [Amycolatopsis sp.]